VLIRDSFVGGHYSQPSKNIYWRTNYSHGEPLIFQFCCRPAGKLTRARNFATGNLPFVEFLEHVNIVRYPPPLHSFPWAQLDQDERRFALQKLQEIAKKRATNYGQIQIDPDDWPEEWDPWNIMQPYERHNAFKTLQVRFFVLQIKEHR
jgi:hypothetical protein